MHNRVIVYVCDRCGRKAEQTADAQGQGKAPAGWAEATVAPLDVNDTEDQQAELCDGCSNQIRRYMQPVSAPDNG